MPRSSRAGRRHNVADRAAWEAATVVDADADAWTGPGVHPGRVIATLRRVLPDDAILTTDAGNFAGWAGRGFRFRKPGTFLGPTSGAMGYGVPAAIAASLVHRDRPVVAVVGDGGMAMTMAELETAVREGRPGSSSSSSTTSGSGPSGCGRRRAGPAKAWRPSSGRSTSRGSAVPWALAACAWSAMPTWSPRSARRSSRSARPSSSSPWTAAGCPSTSRRSPTG